MARDTHTHLLTGELTVSGAAKTFCGRVGWEDDTISDEFTDAKNYRFEATSERRKVTCITCRKSAEAK